MSARTPRLHGRSGDRPWGLKEMDVDLVAAMCFIRSTSHAIKIIIIIIILKINNDF